MNADKWQRLINRAFGVPDILDEEGARDLVVDVLSGPMASHEENASMNVARLLDTIGDLGAAGKLNRLFLPSWDDSEDESSAVLEVARLAVVTAQVGEGLVRVAKVTLARMVTFVRAHPFADERGQPFS